MSARDLEALCTHVIADDAVMHFYHRYLRMGSLEWSMKSARAARRCSSSASSDR